jgi:hypothetical protein
MQCQKVAAKRFPGDRYRGGGEQMADLGHGHDAASWLWLRSWIRYGEKRRKGERVASRDEENETCRSNTESSWDDGRYIIFLKHGGSRLDARTIWH